MELDQLKSLWKDAGETGAPLAEQELQQMLRQRSQHPIARMKRNLLLEVVFLIISYGLLIFILEADNHDMHFPYIIFMLLAAILFFIYALYKYKVLHHMQCVACEVKSNLQSQLVNLEKLVKLYFYVGNIFVFVAYTLTGLITYMSGKTPDGSPLPMPGIVPILIFLGIGAAFTVLAYFINRWYLFKLYGQHIQKLKNILYEMDETPTV